MTTDHEASRAAFEAAHKWYHPFRMPGGAYFELKMERDWQAWCRALDYAASRECEWHNDIDDDCYRSGCKGYFSNEYKPLSFCPRCGGRVRVLENVLADS